ncbi:MAG: amidohydrolase family protein [Thermodesulfobacteriota bacterium]|nr:amidohydrolase family protein [Thermodesulfobacteriota bacterium]
MTANSTDTWHRAGWVITDPETIIRDGTIHVSNGRITAVKSGKAIGPDPVVDHGPGVLMPALINAHTHLELGALKEMLPRTAGFETWVRHLIKARAELRPEALLAGIQAGIDELIDTGCGAVGEIATLGLSKAPFFASILGGIWFEEHLGNILGDFPTIPNDPSGRTSLAGHAPHTTSPDLLAGLKRATMHRNKPFSIHLSESNQEVEFIQSGKGPWANLLREHKIDFSSWPLPARSPVDYLEQLNILDEKTLAVHLLQADLQDFETLTACRVSVAVCPRSNQRLHDRLPDLMRMHATGLNICLGTDSLASCDSLNMFDEMAYAAKRFSFLSPETILAMATTNGARALGLETEYGRLAPGYRFSSVYAPLTADRPETVLEKIITAQFAGK